MTEPAATEEFVMTRVFDASRELVYQAFTDPDKLGQWYARNTFYVPRENVEIDARVGGRQRIVMLSEDDPTFSAPVEGTFTEVVQNEVLAMSEDFGGVPGLQGRTQLAVRIEFHDADGKTRVVLRQGPFTDAMMSVVRSGREESFAKLDALLAGVAA